MCVCVCVFVIRYKILGRENGKENITRTGEKVKRDVEKDRDIVLHVHVYTL